MQMELSTEEQALIENYRSAGDIDKEHLRWMAGMLARVKTELNSGGTACEG